ncbi:hypothetical protein [Arthrobacter sp. zg-Y1110]|uniref:hypothetical protein n=1 Tax=Arthrobacter sp. zg-Y1110 TaxID=2886932 RepID=UPI001D13534A|nr:hypothetical protein [Arthrobacter sp. zg-Y1110]MCC3292971.1 hypothetical protein [Arthrobacter sp. zg-Y1110]UWX86910.1 hypothetical protein N2K99_18880 [Arthrobacter sp. zg-Y1110]
MSTVTPPADDTVNTRESIAVPDIFSYVTPGAWSVSLIRTSSQILSLSVAVAAVRANVKGSRASVAAGVAAIAATVLYKRCHKTSFMKEAFLEEFGITLAGSPLRFSDFTKARKDGGFPFIASVDGVRGIYTLHEKDDRISVTDPAGVKLQRISRR